jgi:hypothetical protein
MSMNFFPSSESQTIFSELRKEGKFFEKLISLAGSKVVIWIGG